MLARLFREEVDLPTLRELQKMRFPQATGNAAADELPPAVRLPEARLGRLGDRARHRLT